MRLLPLHDSIVQYAMEEVTELPGSGLKRSTKWRSIIEALYMYERSITGIGRR